MTCRPADLLKPELAELEADVRRRAQEKGIQLAETPLTTCSPWRCSRKSASNSLRTAIIRRRLSHCRRRKPRSLPLPRQSRSFRYLHRGSGRQSLCGESQRRRRYQPAHCGCTCCLFCSCHRPGRRRHPVTAPLAGNIWKVIATEGQSVAEGDVLLILEAMKMETEIRAAQAGTVRGIAVKSGDAVSVGDTLMTLA